MLLKNGEYWYNPPWYLSTSPVFLITITKPQRAFLDSTSLKSNTVPESQRAFNGWIGSIQGKLQKLLKPQQLDSFDCKCLRWWHKRGISNVDVTATYSKTDIDSLVKTKFLLFHSQFRIQLLINSDLPCYHDSGHGIIPINLMLSMWCSDMLKNKIAPYIF